MELGMIRMGRMGSNMLRHSEHYQYDLNLAGIADVWRRRCVIASWLLDLSALRYEFGGHKEKLGAREGDAR